MKNTFDFVGTVYVPEKWHNRYDKNNGITETLRFAIKPSANNSEYVSLLSWRYEDGADFYTSLENDKGKYIWTKIKYADRNKQEIIDKTMYANQYQTNVGCSGNDKKVFIYAQDFLDYLKKHIPATLKDNPDQMFRVQGEFEVSPYNGKYYENFNIKNIWLSDATEGSMYAHIDLYYTKDSLDSLGAYTEGKHYINGRVLQYDRKEKKNLFFPITLTLEEPNKEDETAQKRKDIMIKVLSKNVKKDDVYRMAWIVEVFNGAPEKEPSLEDLTDDQREAVEAGLMSIEDCMGRSFGENIKELKIIRYNLKGEFANGRVKTPFDLKTLEEDSHTMGEREVVSNSDFIEEATKELDLDLDIEDDDLPF